MKMRDFALLLADTGDFDEDTVISLLFGLECLNGLICVSQEHSITYQAEISGLCPVLSIGMSKTAVHFKFHTDDVLSHMKQKHYLPTEASDFFKVAAHCVTFDDLLENSELIIESIKTMIDNFSEDFFS